MGHFILFVVNFDQLKDRVAITISRHQRECPGKTRTRKSSAKLRASLKHRADYECCRKLAIGASLSSENFG
jgi:hypothetical protein